MTTTATCRDCGKDFAFVDLFPMVDDYTSDDQDYLLCGSCLDAREEQ